MTVKGESFTAQVKRNLRVIVLISSHEKEMGAEKQRLSETEIYIYTWPNDSSTHPRNKIHEHSPVHYLIPYAGHLPAQNNDCHMFYQTDIISVFHKSFVNPPHLTQESMDKTIQWVHCFKDTHWYRYGVTSPAIIFWFCPFSSILFLLFCK